MNDFYQSNYQAYYGKTFKIDPTSFLEPFSTRLPGCASILDIGCGSGRDLLWMKNRGFKVKGFERSEGLAALAGKNAGCEVIEGDFEQYDFSLHAFDGVVLVGALVHLTHERMPQILGRISKALKTGGVLLITLKEGQGRFYASDGRIFELWRDSELEKVFMDLDLKILDSRRQISKLNQKDVWLGYVLRKSPEPVL